MRTLLILMFFVAVAEAQDFPKLLPADVLDSVKTYFLHIDADTANPSFVLDSVLYDWPITWEPKVEWYWVWTITEDKADSVLVDRALSDPDLWDEVGDSSVARWLRDWNTWVTHRYEYPRFHWVHENRVVKFDIGLREDSAVVWRRIVPSYGGGSHDTLGTIHTSAYG